MSLSCSLLQTLVEESGWFCVSRCWISWCNNMIIRSLRHNQHPAQRSYRELWVSCKINRVINTKSIARRISITDLHKTQLWNHCVSFQSHSRELFERIFVTTSGSSAPSFLLGGLEIFFHCFKSNMTIFFLFLIRLKNASVSSIYTYHAMFLRMSCDL